MPCELFSPAREPEFQAVKDEGYMKCGELDTMLLAKRAQYAQLGEDTRRFARQVADEM